MATDDLADTPPPPPSRGNHQGGHLHDLFGEDSPRTVWDFLDDMTSETQLRAHLKASTPPPADALLVMTWRTRQEVKAVKKTSSRVLAELSEVRGEMSGVQATLQTLVDIIGARGKWAGHVASVCKLAVTSIGRVTESIVGDPWVRRGVVFAFLVAALGGSGFTYFRGSYGNAEIDFGQKNREQHDVIPPHPHGPGIVPVQDN